MKTALISLILVLAGSSFAAEKEFCKGNLEAQIIAEITEVKTDSLTYCVAKISPESVSFFSENWLCPLSLEVIVEKGISYPLMNGHDCEISMGEKITGVLIQDKGRIYFEY